MESDPLKLADETEEGAVGILRRLGKSSTLTVSVYPLKHLYRLKEVSFY